MLACVEVGGSGVQTVLLTSDGGAEVQPGPHHPVGATLLIATPGVVYEGRVTALNLGWADVDPSTALGLSSSAALVMNDAEAAALGESALRGGVDLLRIGLGTGVGAAVVRDGVATGNLLAHRTSVTHGSQLCRCGARGCLETVAGGWALPAELHRADVSAVVHALVHAVDNDPATRDLRLVVLAGGLVRTHPELLPRLAEALPRHVVEPTAARAGVKSAAAWGLQAAWVAVEVTAG